MTKDDALALVAARIVANLGTSTVEELTGFAEEDLTPEDARSLDAAVTAAARMLRALGHLPGPRRLRPTDWVRLNRP